jgi:hypothetical protein
MWDQSGVVLDWLARLILVGGLAAVVLVDTGAILVNRVGLESTADEVATEVSTLVVEGGVSPADTYALEAAARAVARPVGAKVVRASVDPKGVFHIRLERVATTIALGHVGVLEGLLQTSASGRAGTN